MQKILILACTLALAGLSTSALAADDGQGFVRVEAGKSNIDFDVDGRGSDSDDDTAWAVRGGYWFTPNFGAEVAYTTLYDKANFGYNVELSGYAVGAVAKKNFGANNSGFFVSGRAGINHLEGKLSTAFGHGKDSSNKVYAGVGAGYDFNEMFGLSLNYDYTQGDFFDDAISVDANTVTLGAEMRF